MGFILRKHFWTVNLIVIAICALFAANGINAVFATSMVPAIEDNSWGTEPPSGGSASASKTARVIIDRNIFCSSCEGSHHGPAVRESSASQSRELTIPATLQLIATLVSDMDPTWSFAVIRNSSNHRASLVGINSKVADGMAVAAIDRGWVLLAKNGKLGQLEMEPDRSVNAGDKNVDRPTGKQRLSAGIQEVGKGKYEIQRALLDRVLTAPALYGRARIVPRLDDAGRANGFSVFGVRPGSFYDLIGLENGDTIHAINGHRLTSPETALAIYNKLKHASHISISFTRRSEAITYDYTIV